MAPVIAEPKTEPKKVALATVRQAGEFLSLSRAKIYNMMDAGELSYVKIGGSRRIAWSALEKLIARCTVGSDD